MSAPAVQANLPEKLEPLFQPYRYKVLYGGRGSGKSVGIARVLLIQAALEKHRILCARELQVSMRDSVHKLLADQIDALGLAGFYEVQQAVILGANGSEFIFKGLRHNISEIKSTQGVTKCWVEEAQTVSKASWDTLIPTIREPNSEIYISFNPDLPEDATYRDFVAFPKRNSAVIKLNWSDNPFFPDVLRDEMEDLRERDHNAWLNVWQGECRSQVDNPLWTKETIEGCRLPAWSTEDERQVLIGTFRRIVVAVDPSGCSGRDDERSDEIGISVAGVGHDGIGRVLADLSGRYSPHGWAQIVCAAYRDWKADRVIAEKNFGGAMVESTIRSADANVPVSMVDASRGKKVRAEPVAALYEQGKVKHVGFLPDLERQLLQFSTSGYKGARSPDRADALVHGITALMLEESTTGVLDFYRERVNEKRLREAETFLKARSYLDHEGNITAHGRQALTSNNGRDWERGAWELLQERGQA